MTKYYKRISNNKVIGLGYVPENNKDLFFQTFEDSEEFIQKEISVYEFIKLGIEYKFEGFKHECANVPMERSISQITLFII